MKRHYLVTVENTREPCCIDRTLAIRTVDASTIEIGLDVATDAARRDWPDAALLTIEPMMRLGDLS